MYNNADIAYEKGVNLQNYSIGCLFFDLKNFAMVNFVDPEGFSIMIRDAYNLSQEDADKITSTFQEDTTNFYLPAINTIIAPQKVSAQ